MELGYALFLEEAINRWESDLRSKRLKKRARAIRDIKLASLYPEEVPLLSLLSLGTGLTQAQILNQLLKRFEKICPELSKEKQSRIAYRKQLIHNARVKRIKQLRIRNEGAL